MFIAECTTVKVDLEDAYKDTAIRATKLMHLGVAGVDILEAADGAQGMEVNSSPGLEDIETAPKST